MTGAAPGPAADRTALFERVLQPEPGRTALLVVDMPEGFLATLDIIRRAYGRVVSAKEIADVVSAW